MLLPRRSVLAGMAAMLSAPYAGSALAANETLRFGVVADPQYADAPPNLELQRYYANSLEKLRAAIETFNGEHLHFVATLGDIIDRHWSSYDAILPLYQTVRHGKVTLLGNHDFEVGAEHLREVVAQVGLKRAYYDFAVGTIRFVVLAGNDVSLFAPPPGDPRWQLASDRLGRLTAANALNAKPWNGSLGDAQFAWMGETIQATAANGERVIVMNHYPVFPANMHNMWDSDRVVSLLTDHRNVVAYLCGHNHAGNYGERDGLHFINFKGMVDTPAENAYAMVEIRDDSLEIKGFGRETNRTLKLRSV